MSEDPVIYEANTMAMADKRNRIRDNAKRMIWVTFQREGIHKFPAAATDPNLQDVAFLANEHRHIFHLLKLLHLDLVL